MTTPQNPGKRRKQKVRRTKQLEQWRAKKAASDTTDRGAAGPAPAPKTAAK
jgi:hypothetical protein